MKALRTAAVVTFAATVLSTLGCNGQPVVAAALINEQALSSAALSQNAMSTNFHIEVDGQALGFSDVSGLGTEVEIVEEYKDGQDAVVRKRPGRVKFQNITLKRGITDQKDPLLQWHKDVMAGKVDRKSGSIVYLDREGNEVLRYSFYEGWPAKWLVKSETNPMTGRQRLVEEIELAVDYVERAK